MNVGMYFRKYDNDSHKILTNHSQVSKRKVDGGREKLMNQIYSFLDKF